MPEAAVLPEVYPADTGAPAGATPHTGHLAPSPQPLAGFGARANSSLTDYVAPVVVLNLLLSLVVATGGVAWRPAPVAVGYLVLLLGFGVWNSGYLQGTTGQSLGRRVTRTKLVTIETGQPVGFGRAVVRQICHGLEFGIGFLWPLWDGKRQTFADKIVRTVVLRVDPQPGADGATEDRTGSATP